MSEITSREQELLQYIVQYLQEKGGPLPRNNSWFMEKMVCSTNNIANLKGRLKDKEYLDDGLFPTDKARRFLEQVDVKQQELRRVSISARIPIQGEVVAGKLRPEADGVQVVLNEQDNPSDDILQIPKSDRNVIALRVLGKSMENEGIYEGDFVIVEKFLGWPIKANLRQNDMIVTKYLPDEKAFGEQTDPDDFIGPTLKIYRQVEGDKIELGWKKDNEGNPWRIRPAAIEPIGKVIGIYKPI